MQDKNSIMIIFFNMPLGLMLSLSSLIFIIYCVWYEIKNNKKIYKEAKRLAITCMMIGFIISSILLFYINKNMF